MKVHEARAGDLREVAEIEEPRAYQYPPRWSPETDFPPCAEHLASRTAGEAFLLTHGADCYYSNYMTARLIRIGNSRGFRLPNDLIRLYHLHEGDEVQLEERREGLLVRIGKPTAGVVSWDAAYRELAAEVAERDEWSSWDVTSGDRIED